MQNVSHETPTKFRVAIHQVALSDRCCGVKIPTTTHLLSVSAEFLNLL